MVSELVKRAAVAASESQSFRMAGCSKVVPAASAAAAAGAAAANVAGGTTLLAKSILFYFNGISEGQTQCTFRCMVSQACETSTEKCLTFGLLKSRVKVCFL